MASIDTLHAFDSLPTRLFFDSSTLQAIDRYGAFLWDGVALVPACGGAITAPTLPSELEALRFVLQVNQRAGFDIVISDTTLSEVADKGDSGYTDYAGAVRQHWLTRIDDYQGRAFRGEGDNRAATLDGHAFGYLSIKDRRLLRDALSLECHAFLTLDGKLTKNAAHLEAATGIRVLLPSDYWALLRPWAALWI